MKPWIVMLVVAGLASGAEIPKGAHVLLRMVNSINSRTAEEGDYVYLRTATPITAGDHIVVPVDSYVQGVVSHVKRSGKVAGRARLGIRLETLTLSGGRVLKFSPRLAGVDAGESGQKVENKENLVEQAAGHGRDAGQVAIYAGSGAAIGGLADRSWKGAGIGGGIGSAVGLATVMLTRGREVELRQGMTMDVVFDRPVAID